MTLEDFFTLTEIKNGLATLARVEELISVMQEQKASVTSNIGETARQCSTCACTLTATENKDCLGHFVALNGLCFINQWLQEALKCGDAVANSVIEDLVSALLSSLERLPVNREKPSASEIWSTVEQFQDHRCHRIGDQARSLLEKWNKATTSGANFENSENAVACQDNQLRPPDSKTSEEAPNLLSVADADQCKASSSDGKGSAADHLHKDINLKVAVKETEAELKTKKNDECKYNQDRSLSTSSKPVMKAGASYDTGPEERNDDISSPGKSVINTVLPCNTTDTKGTESSLEEDEEPAIRIGDVGHNLPKYNQNYKELSSFVDARMDIDDASDNGFNSRNVDGSPSLCQGKETEDVDSDDKDLQCVGNLEAGKKLKLAVADISSRSMEEKGGTEIDHKSDMDLECGDIDALEVARQVAIEVEREVVDYREPLCSSSPEINSGETMDADKPDLVVGNQQKLVDNQIGNEISTGNDPSNLNDDCLAISEKNKHVAGKGTSLALTPIKHEPESKIDEDRCGFDLNEDVHIEDFDPNPRPRNPVSSVTTVPVAVVKGAPDFPINQLHFEGKAGWKGSAATSAFRPASPRRTPDGEQTYSGPMQRTSVHEFEFDLNIADENEDTPVVEPAKEKTPLFSGILYRDLSLEASSTKVEKRKLDLNCAEDEEASPYPSFFHWNLHHHNGDQSLSSASSSSSRHPPIIDFDLNDSPVPQDSGVSRGIGQPFPKVLGMYAGSKLDDPAATITDSRMVVHAPRHYYANGFDVESSLPARPVLPYHQMVPPVYGYTGQQAWPYLPAYGPGAIPYTVNARGGAPVVPQMLSTARVGSAPSTVPPFLMNLAGEPSSSKGFGASHSGLDSSGAPSMVPRFMMTLAGEPSSSKGSGASHSGLDLNSGTAVMIDNGSKEADGFRQFLMPGQNGLVEAQTVNSGMTLKRKEPDSSRDPYTLTLWP